MYVKGMFAWKDADLLLNGRRLPQGTFPKILNIGKLDHEENAVFI